MLMTMQNDHQVENVCHDIEQGDAALQKQDTVIIQYDVQDQQNSPIIDKSTSHSSMSNGAQNNRVHPTEENNNLDADGPIIETGDIELSQQIPNPLAIDLENGLEQQPEAVQNPNPQAMDLENGLEKQQTEVIQNLEQPNQQPPVAELSQKQIVEADESKKMKVISFSKSLSNEIRKELLENQKDCIMIQYYLFTPIRMIIFIVYACHIVRYHEEVTFIYGKYPQAIEYLFLCGIDTIFQFLIACYYIGENYSIDFAVRTWKIRWTGMLILIAFNFWGFVHVFSPKFEQIRTTEGFSYGQKAICDMTKALAIIRLLYVILYSLILIIMFFVFLGVQCPKNNAEYNKNRETLELIFVCLWTPKDSKNILRSYSEDKDKHANCSICLGDFSEHPEQHIVQLDCSEHHTFHYDCFKDWMKTKQICPLCREQIVL